MAAGDIVWFDQALLDLGKKIQGNTGAAIALALTGTVTNNPIILGQVGRAIAAGLQGSVSGSVRVLGTLVDGDIRR